jgi:hypothetical protein
MNNVKNKSVVEETLLQIKAVEDAINENAKGILATTMKQEISELVKESLGGSKKSRSLREQEETPVEPEGDEMEDDGSEDFEEVETEVDTEVPSADAEMGFEVDAEVDNQETMPPLDMTQSPMSDVMKVFKAMGDEDGIIVKKDESGNIHLTDTNKGSDYLIQMDGMSNSEMPMNAETTEGVLYELSFEDDEMDYEMDDEMDYEMDDEMDYEMDDEMDGFEELDMEFEENVNPMMTKGETGSMTSEKDETLYELEVEMDEMDDLEEAFKPKGRVGKMKFKYPSKLKRGVTEMGDMENENEWKEMEDMDGMVEGEDEDEDGEMGEASRTLGNGKYWGRKGLPKPKAAPRHIRVESVNTELNLLREKNEEYKKALDFFRNKLNEVAVFNSNLAYSTRLFTEHTTTKQEKINILRRFDNVESLKESKTLYRTIKSELDGKGGTNTIKESIERKVISTPSNGSSSNLIESKTYENPQFLRMKDLMAKIK